MKAGAPTEQLSPWAVASLVFGIAGLGVAATKFPIPILPSVVAIVLAQTARRDLRRSRGRRRGRNLATAGWWLGWLGILERILVAILVEQDEPWLFDDRRRNRGLRRAVPARREGGAERASHAAVDRVTFSTVW